MAKRTKKQAKREPKWKMIERVVGLLEAALDPDAKVEHNVDLPDLATPGHTRQCDVVVTTGPQHRRTRTIVEVQRRGRKVEVAHFDGWVAKMRTVGAQHLICVSSAGYPLSITDKAAQLGPTVRLITLKELEGNSPLVQGALGKVRVRQVGTTDFPKIELLVKKPAHVGPGLGEILQHETNFLTAQGEKLSLNQIAQRLLNAHRISDNLEPGTHPVQFETSDSLTFIQNEAFGPVRLRFTANVVVHDVGVSCEVLEYKHSSEDDPLAWILIGETPRPDAEGVYELKVTFRPGSDGRLTPHAVNIVGLVPGDMFSAEVAQHRVGPILVS